MINKEKFERYESIRSSGLINMFDVTGVVNLSDGILCRDDCLDIMKNYSQYKKQFGDDEV